MYYFGIRYRRRQIEILPPVLSFDCPHLASLPARGAVGRSLGLRQQAEFIWLSYFRGQSLVARSRRVRFRLSFLSPVLFFFPHPLAFLTFEISRPKPPRRRRRGPRIFFSLFFAIPPRKRSFSEPLERRYASWVPPDAGALRPSWR